MGITLLYIYIIVEQEQCKGYFASTVHFSKGEINSGDKFQNINVFVKARNYEYVCLNVSHYVI